MDVSKLIENRIARCEYGYADVPRAELSQILLALTAERERADKAEQALGNLLAIIHRDGGHHTGSVGQHQSVSDAHQVWAALQTERDDLTRKLAEAVEVVQAIIAEGDHTGGPTGSDGERMMYRARAFIQKQEAGK